MKIVLLSVTIRDHVYVRHALVLVLIPALRRTKLPYVLLFKRQSEWSSSLQSPSSARQYHFSVSDEALCSKGPEDMQISN